MSEAHTKLNKGTVKGADKAAEHLPALTRAYSRALRAAGRRAAAKMRQTQTRALTAATDPQQPPNWVPPPPLSLIDQQELADDTQAKTAKLHKQMLTASAESALQPFDISFDIRAPTSQAMLDAVAQRIQDGITSAIQEQIQEAITNGYANGSSVDHVARDIVTATNKITPVRADMLARTDLNALSNGGSLLAASISGATATKTWLATEDERTRETHSEADGQTVGINDTFDVGGETAQYPGDPSLSDEESCNCFPGETLVAGTISGAMRSGYSGTLIQIKTHGGRVLSGTPNHPILLRRGWAALKDVRKGDQAICASFDQRPMSGTADVDDMPSRLDEVWDSLAVVSPLKRIAAAYVNFHGDGAQGDVDVVFADGLLELPCTPSFLKPAKKFTFSVSDELEILFADECSHAEFIPSDLAATPGFVGERGQVRSFFGSHSGDANILSLLDRPPLDPRIVQPTLDDDARCAESSGDLLLGSLLLDIETDDFNFIDSDLVGVGGEVLSLAVIGDRLVAHAEHCSNLGVRESRLVEFDDVVSVDALPSHGDVLTLETEKGLYIANGFIAQNCRCTLTYGEPLTASAALAKFRDYLWEGSFDYDLVASSHADAVTSGGDMSTISDKYVPITMRVPQELIDGATLIAAASGDTGLPLSERDRAWDAGEATGRVKKWASSDGSGDPDKIDYGKLARAYFWQDPASDGGAKIGDFKLPFADIIGGKLIAVWRGVTAGAQRLSQTQGIDKGAVQKKMSAYYSKASKAFDDPSIKPPWASGSASVDGERLAAVRTFLADNGADVIEDDELRAIILVAESFASQSKHRYAGNGGACAICGMAPSNKDAHFAAETITASLENFALLAAVDGGTPWTATLCVTGVPTVDNGVKRILAPDGGSWLPLPLPLMLMDDGPHSDGRDAPICGRIDSISVAGNAYQAAGVFFDDSSDLTVRAIGSKAAALVGEMRRLGISIDMVDTDWDLMAYVGGSVIDPDAMDDANDPIADGDDGPGGPATEANYPDDIPMPGDDDEIQELIDPDGDGDVDFELIMCATQWVIAGATICPVQALAPQSTISLIASAAKRTGKWNTETDVFGPVLTASAAGLAPELPPAEWFEDPKLERLTALTVTEDGRVFGHMAPWDGCHTGFPGTCVPPPRSPSNYAGFHLGELVTADGGKVAVGTLTMDTGHAGHRLSAERAVAHYDNTGTAAAYVRAGEDQFGIWVAGTLSARLSAADAQALMASKPSGDWREVFRGKGRDLIGALQVNVPGFPVPRALTASGLLPDGVDAVQFVESPVCVPCEAEVDRELAVLVASVDGIEGLASLVA